MTESNKIQDWHKNEAIKCFNETWDLLDKSDRSEDEALIMIHKAHASRFHWGEVGDYGQFATGEWQISRVYATLNMYESALYHGQASLKNCEEGQLSPFDFAFAYEALARACAIKKDMDSMNLYLAKAKGYAQKVSDLENQKYIFSELDTIS
jgi:hypothetical protein